MSYDNVCESGSRLLKSMFDAENMQVVLGYQQLFRCNSLVKCALQPKKCKKFTKTLLSGVQGLSSPIPATWTQ